MSSSAHEPLRSETSSLSQVEVGPEHGGGGGGVGGGGHVKGSNWRLFGLGMFFLFYLAFGATVFSSIERPLETEIVNELMQKKREFLKNHPCLTDDDLEEFMGEIVSANNRGVEIFKNGTSVSSWSFGQSFFFSSTVVTTIGYGHQSPLSSEGKLFCMAYAVVGIPMTLLLLTAVVERLLVPVDAGLGVMLRAMDRRMQPIYVHILHFSMVMLSVVVLLFLLPALVFMWLEPHWGFLDSLYYCFISLTTVGLGDFIPGDSPGQTWRPLYKACTTFYLLLGVTAMMLCLTVFYRIPSCDLQLLFLLPKGAADCLKGGANGTTVSGGGAGGGGGSNGGNNEDPERIRLQTAAGGRGPKYTQQRDDGEEDRRQKNVIRARARPNDDDDSSSPAEETRPKPSTSRGGGGRSKPVPVQGARGKR